MEVCSAKVLYWLYVISFELLKVFIREDLQSITIRNKQYRILFLASMCLVPVSRLLM